MKEFHYNDDTTQKLSDVYTKVLGEIGENPGELKLQSVSGLGTLKQSDTLSDDA